MTYRIEIPSAAKGDVVEAVVFGAMLSVTRNGKDVSHAEYQLSCDHQCESAGCPACLERNEGLALRDSFDRLSRGVGVRARGTWPMGGRRGVSRSS
jgi:hypothetical protein